MKHIVLYCLHLMLLLPCIAQHRIDRFWLSGYDNNQAPPNAQGWGGQRILFNENGIEEMTASFYPIDFSRATAATGDVQGNLRFFTNGVVVCNKNNEIIPNSHIRMDSDSLGYEGYKDGYFSSPTFIPSLIDANLYCMFYHNLKIVNAGGINTTRGWNLYCMVLDKSLNNGLGGVVTNTLIVEDTLDGVISAVKHGNGRDWWLIVPCHRAAEYYRILITPTGIQAPILAKMNFITNDYTFACESVFSRDGSKYVRQDKFNHLFYVFDFDRCNGNLTNVTTFPIDSSDSGGAFIALSPNGKILYAQEASQTTRIVKYKLDTLDIAASRKIVGAWDGFGGIFGGLGPMFLAPDNNIYSVSNLAYVSKLSSTNDYSNCFLSLHNIQTPTRIHGAAVPNYPNYALSALDGSACDTLGLSNQLAVNSKQVKVYPNPAQNYVQVELPQGVKEATFVLYNGLGQEVKKEYFHRLNNQGNVENQRIALGSLGKGLYFYEVITDKGKMYGKLQIE